MFNDLSFYVSGRSCEQFEAVAVKFFMLCGIFVKFEANILHQGRAEALDFHRVCASSALEASKGVFS